MDNSLPSVDDVIRAITGQSPRQSVDEIMGAVNQLLEIEVENRTLTGDLRGGGLRRRRIQPTHLRALGMAILIATIETSRLGLTLEADMRRLRNPPSDNRVPPIRLGKI